MEGDETHLLFSKKDLWKLIIPLVIEQILAMTLGMADIIMVSSLGESAVSGVSLVDTLNVLIINIFAALATGGAVVASQYIGQKHMDEACITAKQLLLTTFTIALFIMAIGLIFREGLMYLLYGSAEPEVMYHAQIYFFISLLTYPSIALYNAGAALFRAMGNSKISMYVSLLVNIINIGGNALLIYGLGFGVEGAAIPTFISRTAAAVVLLIALKKKNNPIHVARIFRLDYHLGYIKKILRIGVPNSLENSMFQIGKILVLGLIATFGTASIAANAAASTISGFAILPGQAIGFALITVVGQCIGAGDEDQAKYYTKKLMKYSYLMMWGLNIFILLLSRQIIGLYQMSPETSEIGWQLLTYHSLASLIFWPAAFTLPNALRAANDVKFTMISSSISMWALRIGFSYILGQTLGWGVLGVWVAMTLDWVLRAGLFIWRFYSGRWRGRQYV